MQTTDHRRCELRQMNRQEYDTLKSMGLLWEFYPDAPDTFGGIDAMPHTLQAEELSTLTAQADGPPEGNQGGPRPASILAEVRRIYANEIACFFVGNSDVSLDEARARAADILSRYALAILP